MKRAMRQAWRADIKRRKKVRKVADKTPQYENEAVEDYLDKIREAVESMNYVEEGSFGQREHLVTIRDAATRGIELLTPAWVAGWNMPGYLPESDPGHFDDWHSARGYVHEAISRFWDEDYATSTDFDHPRKVEFREQVDAKWLPVDTALNSVTADEPFGVMTADGSLVFWVVRWEEAK